MEYQYHAYYILLNERLPLTRDFSKVYFAHAINGLNLFISLVVIYFNLFFKKITSIPKKRIFVNKFDVNL
jgi:hypothetical protein